MKEHPPWPGNAPNGAAPLCSRPVALGRLGGIGRTRRYRPLVHSTRPSVRMNAPRAVVYRALLDPRAVAKRKVPTGMTSQVHELDAREGGSFRVSLMYEEPTGSAPASSATRLAIPLRPS